MSAHGNITGESPEIHRQILQAVHDIRTPLSAMKTSVAILKMISSDPEKSARLVQMMDKQVDDISEKLEKLVAISVTSGDPK